jgi:azurin
MKDKVIAATGILGPNETSEVTFTVPAASGDYPFLCSFPGHCVTGMKGVLVVKK